MTDNILKLFASYFRFVVDKKKTIIAHNSFLRIVENDQVDSTISDELWNSGEKLRYLLFSVGIYDDQTDSIGILCFLEVSISTNAVILENEKYLP
jgi:hypothetical protein